ncbi:MAG TPA: DEAD/DEAH box helicase [Gemmatimonadales bacterium]|nr:DEAD/DEAH box helicase [Gemmatimonadales bacterium]
MHWTHPPRILSEHLAPLPEPLACLLTPGAVGPAPAVAALGARALLDLTPLALERKTPWPAWLAPHQVPAAERLTGILGRHGGALLADAVGLGKSYVALAVALALSEPFALVVPAVLVRQWRGLLERYDADAPIITHESLSMTRCRPLPPLTAFSSSTKPTASETPSPTATARSPSSWSVRVLLVTATPVHNRIADLFHLFRLFLRDHDLTALGVPSLCRAARGDADPHAVTAAAARLSVSRSRERVQAGYDTGPGTLPFPERAAGEAIRVGTAPDVQLQELVAGVAQLEAGGEAAALFRLLLLSQLASSLPAFRVSLVRYDAFLELGVAAAAQGRALGRRDFRRLFPAGSDDLQLALFPLVLPPGPGAATERDRHVVGRLRVFAASLADPKADALARLLEGRVGKTIVFVQPRATVHYLMPRLRGHRLAAVTGERGWFGKESARREDVLRAFAPRAQGAPLPPLALETDVLIATDLLSEGLNLQDAVRVIHYDLPWSPARLAQRVGRIDRAGSPHERIETVTFLPPPSLADALAMERRLVTKRRMQSRAGAGPRALDWCDRLQGLAARAEPPAAPGTCAAVGGAGAERAVVLVVRLGGQVEGVVVTDAGARADPARATRLLEQAAVAEPAPFDSAALARAIRRAAPLLRNRLAALEDARWRGAHRDRLSRRLIPWVLAAARRAATERRQSDLARLDGLVSRLAIGMTAGEELRLEDLLARRAPLSVREVLAWHDRLPPIGAGAEPPQVELMAALVLG